MSFWNRFIEKNGYVDSYEDEDVRLLFDMWVADFPDYIVHYKSNNKSDILTINEPNMKTYHIIWDVSFWDLFTKFFYINDEHNFSTQLDTNILLENSGYTLALFFNYLSKRYKFYPELSEQLKYNSAKFGYRMLVENLYGNKYEKQNYDFPVLICKQFAFWHEVAHVEFQKYDEENSLYQRYISLIYEILDKIPNNLFADKTPFFSEIERQIKTRTVATNLIEELAADLRAIQRMMQFEYISGIKDNLAILVESVVTLIDFTMIKLVLDKRWDYYVFKKAGTPPTLIETQIIRGILFPLVVYIRLGSVELGDSFLSDIKERRDNIELFSRNLDIIESEWYIKFLLGEPHQEKTVNISDTYQQIALLYTIYSHMFRITVNISSKRLKYLFNIAHTVQHSDSPLDCIPLFYKFIDAALKKEDENKRNIGDAYSRIARVYAENGQFEKAKIILNNAVDICEKLSNDDINSAFLYNNIGNVFQKLGNIDKAYDYFSQSMKIRKKFGDINSTSTVAVYGNLGFCLYARQAYYQALKYYLKAYRILKFRYDDNSDLENIKDALRFFACLSTNISKVIVPGSNSLIELRQAYETNKNDLELLKQHLLGMVRDLLLVSFDKACDLYIEIVELLEVYVNEPSLYGIYFYAFVNIQESLKSELNLQNNGSK